MRTVGLKISDIKAKLIRPVAFYPQLARVTGSIGAGLMLSQCLYWDERTRDPNRWFFKSQVEWKEETGLSRWQQESARKRLLKLGLLHEYRRYNPSRVYFRVNSQTLSAAIQQHANASDEFSQSALWQSNIAEGETVSLPSVESSHVLKEAEITAETTSQSTSFTPDADSTPKPIKHQLLKEMLTSAWREHNHVDVGPPWDETEGRQLKLLIKATPDWSVEMYAKSLKHLYQSEGFPPGTRPREFLPTLPRYLQSPLDKFKNAIGRMNENSKASQKERDREERYRRAETKASGQDASS